MKIIITRPVEDALPLAEKLRGLGHDVVIAPVLRIETRSDVPIPQRAYQAICLTSANGVRVLSDVSALARVPVLAVGPQSKQVAIDRGFANVSAVGGDVDGLTRYITENLVPSAGPLLYISGSTTSGDLEGKLRAAGFEVDRVMTYDAKPSSLNGFKNDIQTANAVLLYSPRSAKLWRAGISEFGVTPNIIHVCLSSAIASCLPETWATQIADQPTEAALMAALACLAK